jgi:molecular chaperone GrpE
MENVKKSAPVHSNEDANLVSDLSKESLNSSIQDPSLAPTDTTAFESFQALQEELEQQKTLTLRALADLDNYRKRTLKEKEELRKFAVAGLIEALLPVLDNFELGLKNIPSEAPASFVQGFQMVQEQLFQILKDSGLSLVDPKNEVFNPNTQDCVAHLPHESIPENYIIETVRKGYILQDRLLRSASVLVSSGSSTATTAEEPLS